MNKGILKNWDNWTWICWFTVSPGVCKKRQVIGFDISSKRIRDLKLGIDKTKEVTKKINQIKEIIFN